MDRLTRLDRSIAGKVALVTGAASGIGRATAHLFADEGATVAVVDRDAAGAVRVAEEIEAAGGSAAAWELDLQDAGRIRQVVDEVAARFGGLDILVNNAGVSLLQPADGEDYEAYIERAGAAAEEEQAAETPAPK
mgnify:CR=1 FL=1